MAGKLIAKGAEAEISIEGRTVFKNRVRKEYRIKEIDIPLRKSRARREAKLLAKIISLGINAPSVLKIDEGNAVINMSLIEGSKLRDLLNKNNCKKLCSELGKNVAVLHKNGIIHGDLTTSNIIIEQKTGKMFFIDLGLGSFSSKAEDMAVELHLLRQALESKHNKIWKKSFESFLAGYKKGMDNNEEYESVLARFNQVEERGRNKKK